MIYNISKLVKRVMYMNYQDKLEKLVEKHNGTILSADIDENKIPRIYLQKMVAEGKLEKADRGVYVSIDSIEDEMYSLQTKYSKIIYSHETALYIHGLTDRTPFEYSVSFPSGYKVVPNVADKCKIYYIKNDLHQMGIISAISSFGNSISVYNIERTMCDLIRSRNRIDIQIINDSFKRFVKLKTTDYSLLMEYAKMLKVDKILKNYLEVLI